MPLNPFKKLSYNFSASYLGRNVVERSNIAVKNIYLDVIMYLKPKKWHRNNKCMYKETDEMIFCM